MTKEEFATYLTERGYPAENISGAVIIRKEKPLTKSDLKILHSMIKETGYNASFGYTLCAQ